MILCCCVLSRFGPHASEMWVNVYEWFLNSVGLSNKHMIVEEAIRYIVYIVLENLDDSDLPGVSVQNDNHPVFQYFVFIFITFTILHGLLNRY